MVLLIIDMQRGVVKGDVPRWDVLGVVERINQLTKAVRAKGHQVVFIQHEYPAGSGLSRGDATWEILPELTRESSDHIIHKSVCDSFYLPDLDDYLKGIDQQDLIMTGCCTDFCMDSTIRSAVNKDYKVTVVSDGHTTADRDHLRAGKIIEHHNYVWTELITPNDPVRVVSTEELLNDITSQD